LSYVNYSSILSLEIEDMLHPRLLHGFINKVVVVNDL